MSDLRRFFVPIVTDNTLIDGEEFRHAVSVLRIKVGERVILCDNSGVEYLGEVSEINKKDLIVKVTEKRNSQTEAKEEVILISGYLKGDKTELVVQKAVELGVKKIVVFNSKFCSAYMNENKLSRLNRVSVESAKQCGRAIAPEVIYADSLEEALEIGRKCNNKLFACEFADKNEVELKSIKGSTSIVVGSEGGFAPEEWELAKQRGYKTIYLGKRILRAETASIALASIVMNALGEFE